MIPEQCCLSTFDASAAKAANPPLPPPPRNPPVPAEPVPPPSEGSDPGRRLPDQSLFAVRVVQPNIGQQDKWRPGFSEEAARRLAGLSMRPGDSRPRLLLWPEAAVTDPLEDARTGEHQAFAEFDRTRVSA